MQSVFALRRGVADSARLPAWLRKADAINAAEWIALVLSGVACGLLMVYFPWNIRLPGNAIMRAVFPMALGISLVPRRCAGSIIGIVGGLVVGAAWWQQIGKGHITTTASVVLLGLFLDTALTNARSGWRIYLRFATAGLLANLCALATRWTTATLGLDLAGERSWSWSVRILTYALFGLLAGLISAAVWFRASDKTA